MRESGVSVNLIINRESPPFDNPNIRRALALTLDRKAFIDILSEGEDKVAGIMLPPAVLEGLAGFPRRCDVDHRLFVNGNPIVGMDRVSLGVPAERSLPDDRVAEERIATSGKPLVDDAVDRGSGEPACGVVAP
jgi:ABC-type transport system substrate-binding protein